jgi:hypothetical protein
MEIGDVVPFLAEGVALETRDRRRGVGRVIQDLNLEAVAWVIDACRSRRWRG